MSHQETISFLQKLATNQDDRAEVGEMFKKPSLRKEDLIFIESLLDREIDRTAAELEISQENLRVTHDELDVCIQEIQDAAQEISFDFDTTFKALLHKRKSESQGKEIESIENIKKKLLKK